MSALFRSLICCRRFTSSILEESVLYKTVRRGTVKYGITSGTCRISSIFGKFDCATFHTTSRRHAVWLANPYLYRIVAFVGGRLMRRWWKKLPNKTRRRYVGVLSKSGHWIFVGTLGAFAGSAGYYAYHLEEATISHRRRFMAVDQSEMKEIGDYLFSLEVATAQDKIVSAGHPSYARVLGVTTKLLQANKWDEALDVNWRIVIIDDPTVTAYVMPSGQIVVYTGLLEMMKTDDMLAVILGHEMAHAIMGHMGENASQEQLINFFSLIIVTLVWFLLPDVTAFFTQWLEKSLQMCS
ncbi:metalloendopeptidase OMA1, mitochondrial-like isoform X1 [Corticium candelabrum]|uniref:metalloendopeptidase OMA1, mitochondrial-like isoform X1 n=1 Tax=Corticium candelabrum TaxID=121492 RepID=UPI002E2599D1|nr:metalloendopeptidase OMA1, mitochondrial-like isoform X1 [Corticium candelabrum]